MNGIGQCQDSSHPDVLVAFHHTWHGYRGHNYRLCYPAHPAMSADFCGPRYLRRTVRVRRWAKIYKHYDVGPGGEWLPNDAYLGNEVESLETWTQTIDRHTGQPANQHTAAYNKNLRSVTNDPAEAVNNPALNRASYAVFPAVGGYGYDTVESSLGAGDWHSALITPLVTVISDTNTSFHKKWEWRGSGSWCPADMVGVTWVIDDYNGVPVEGPYTLEIEITYDTPYSLDEWQAACLSLWDAWTNDDALAAYDAGVESSGRSWVVMGSGGQPDTSGCLDWPAGSAINIAAKIPEWWWTDKAAFVGLGEYSAAEFGVFVVNGAHRACSSPAGQFDPNSYWLPGTEDTFFPRTSGWGTSQQQLDFPDLFFAVDLSSITNVPCNDPANVASLCRGEVSFFGLKTAHFIGSKATGNTNTTVAGTGNRHRIYAWSSPPCGPLAAAGRAALVGADPSILAPGSLVPTGVLHADLLSLAVAINDFEVVAGDHLNIMNGG